MPTGDTYVMIGGKQYVIYGWIPSETNPTIQIPLLEPTQQNDQQNDQKNNSSRVTLPPHTVVNPQGGGGQGKAGGTPNFGNFHQIPQILPLFPRTQKPSIS